MMPTMDEITNDETLPEIQPHAIKAVMDEKSDTVEEAKQNGFDAELHETDAHGQPVLTKAGNFRKKRGAGAVKRKTTSKLELNDTPQENSKNEKVKVESKTAAMTTSAILERVQIGMIGEDMAYSDIERAQNTDAWFNLYEYYGGIEVHPALAVAADHTMLVLSRSQKPSVKRKIKTLGEKIAGKIYFWRNKNALFNRGENTKRENNVREKESRESEKTRD